MIRLGVVLAAVNLVLLFVGAPSWGWKYVGLGWLIVLAGIVIYFYRSWSDRRAPDRAVVGVPTLSQGQEAMTEERSPWPIRRSQRKSIRSAPTSAGPT